jgi:urease accessory protein
LKSLRAARAVQRIRKPLRKTTAETATAHSLLQLIWLASPALPVGGFSYSEGLEAAVETGLVSDETATREWLLDQLHLVLARGELAVVAKAFAAWQRGDDNAIGELNAWMTRTRESSEMRLQAEQMGRSLVEWLRNRGVEDVRVERLAALRPAPTWPVAFALAAAQTGAPARDALLAFAFGWAENMVQAALKSVPLGQSAGQRVLAALADAIPAAATLAAGLRESERQAFAPALAIASALHETQYSRLFRS